MINQQNLTKIIVLIVAVILFSISFRIIYEWNTGHLFIANILASHTSMVYNSALCFALAALGLLTILNRLRWLTIGISTILFITAALTIMEYSFGLSLGIDQLFMTTTVDKYNFIPGRMAPNTAACFIVVAIAYLALVYKQKPTFPGLCIAGVASFIMTNSAIFFFAGYFTETPFYGWSAQTYMSFSSAMAFIILGFGLIFLIWHCSKDYKARILKLVPIGIFLSAVVINLLLFHALYVQEQNNTIGVTSTIVEPNFALAYLVLFFGLFTIALLYVCCILLSKVTNKSRELFDMQKKLMHAQTMAKLGNWVWYPQKQQVWCSPETLNILNLDPHHNWLDAKTFFEYIHPSQQESLKKALDELAAKCINNYSETYNLNVNDVEYIVRFEMTNENCTEQEEISGILQNITKIRQLERQLYQSQKMEVIGQLTGGLAHDFNNMLMVIQGNLELLAMSLRGQTNELKRIDTALKAVERGSELTRRLLAFARRQLLQPKLVDVKLLINDSVKLIKPMIGESIELSVITPENLWPIWVDAAQLENALMNLIVNARDAIVDNGKITVEITNLTLDAAISMGRYDIAPGDYVKISITDNGCGISKENLAKVFEPFFTTKQVGKGSGLGLSMVYGFVKQSKGNATIYSEEGHGTTVNLYLPRAIPKESTVPETSKPKFEVVRSGNETILVVEDEPDLLRLTIDFLSDLGYRVISAANGVEALKVVERESNIELLCTDVVMPQGITGPDLAKKLREIYPAIKVLFVSGYTQNALSQNYTIPETTKILTKPYKMYELAVAVRELLDG